MNKHEHIVSGIVPGSIAEELGIESGDKLLAVDGHEIEDIFDYQFYIEDEQILLLIEKPDGEQWELEIEKEADEDLGIEFGQGLMDEYRSCYNKCIFCFIDQMPKGMRDTLYFKDDDSRLSFLQGNYVTLTNMSSHDIERIIRYRLEPINISFQTTNPELRCRMLHNRFAGEALKKVDTLYQGGIEMNGQIVLCKGVNDGDELERSIRDLTSYLPLLKSVSVVPAIAESTTIFLPLSVIMSATFAMRSADPTEVPPNFKTFILLLLFLRDRTQQSSYPHIALFSRGNRLSSQYYVLP